MEIEHGVKTFKIHSNVLKLVPIRLAKRHDNQLSLLTKTISAEINRMLFSIPILKAKF